VESVDPNNIQGPSGYGPSGFVKPELFSYGIEFENKPTATAPAQSVTVTQQLDPNLDWTTFQLGSIGFGSTVISVPSGQMSYSTQVDVTASKGIYVDVTANFNPLTGLATWTFTSIDPTTLDVPADPRAGFLPPDDSAGDGMGFVNYTILPKSSLTTGATVNAQASVVFDINAAIETASILNTIDALPPTSSVAPLPGLSASTFKVSWSGSDDASGSGIASYSIYVADNSGPFTPWLTATTETSASYTGVLGHTYGFYSVATDNVGNLQPTPTAAQATTTVSVAAVLPTSSVAALPALSETSFAVSWSGSDAGGPGIATFDIHVSDNGGPFTTWLKGTTQTASTYQGTLGHTYAFFSIATDKAGNHQPMPTAAQATTQALLKDANAAYVAAVYFDVLGRAPDPGGLAYWTQKLDQGAPISSVASAIGTSGEYYANFVIKPDYIKLLGRTADDAGVQYWTQRMQSGLTDQQLEAQLAASDEFFTTAGGNVNQVDWIDAVYKLLLGRTADPGGEKYWSGRLTALLHSEDAIDARLQVALGIAGSQENNTNLINADYAHYLGRATDPGGLAYWLQQFAAGATNEDVIAGFTGSAEYYKDKTGASP